MAAVNRNMFEAGVFTDSRFSSQGLSIMTLPLNLIARIVDYVEEPADLARVCRTCRVLNYMTLPQLYRNIVLTSYDRIRYRDDQPEGWGSASPFSMGLNALVTRPHATLVQSLTLRGEWKEHELEEHARVGRVPDSSMMLNVAVRAAIDRTANLESFSWELNTKMLETVYIGLVQLPKLTSLSIRFLSSRHPRPTLVIPAMPHLRSFKVTDIDPLCYPDDISTLLAKSRNLQDLRMHWSPRMREAQEPSVIFHDYFRKCISSKTSLKLKTIGFQNLYARHTEDWFKGIEQSAIENVVFLSSPGFDDAAYSSFVDKTWYASRPPSGRSNFKSMRHDGISKGHCEFLASFSGLEKLYFVNPIRTPNDQLNSPRHSAGPSSTTATPPRIETTMNNGSATAPCSAVAQATSPTTPHSPPHNTNFHTLMRDTYFSGITSSHGATLRHLLLPSRWPLSSTLIARLMHACPNLEQLGLAAEISALETFRLLMPFLRKLAVIRLLIPQSNSPDRSSLANPLLGHAGNNTCLPISSLIDVVGLDDHFHTEKIGAVMADREAFRKLKIVGIGWKAWELGAFYTVPAPEESTPRDVVDNGEQADHTLVNSNGTTLGATGLPACIRNTSGRRTSSNLGPPELPTTSPLKSMLGKRPREPSAPSTPVTEFQEAGCTASDSRPRADDIVETLSSGEKVIWRRQVRRVGWDVLKHWEIWALDTQEL